MPDRFRNSTLLHVEDLYQAFGGKVVLDNIDLSVAAGELVTVVGPSGCGKSTLLRIIIGQDRPAGGQVWLDGHQLDTPNRERGVVYQHYSLFPNLTVLDNVLAGHRLRGWPWQKPPAEACELAEHLLAKTGMDRHLEKYPHQLSGGQRQRVAIAQALMQKPRILCMDEPFSALDPGTRETMQLLLLELWEAFGMTVFFVTHDLEEAVYLGTRLVALSPYYTDDRGDGDGVNRGARVVVDRSLRPIGTAVSPRIKTDQAFAQCIQEIRRDAFDPDHRQHVSTFDLSHPHSWVTFTADEVRPAESQAAE
ncbi:ABC transporter ATP-binding protein [Magnetofaba australis]|uniref:Putative nitrate/sulfonate/bicarbonate ABC transporter ATPase n=1 Tax=Magnetofaba australis IT-1 TaxID=1434232 RepID=A0A1Y2K0P1_9PROT|nr:ABC transporter ATP-binding protein [Magnetofaba australis]OSM01591.1 putative nitrate/sulfonate/bicarbonate ABC transporter ATPase [Magnetofaba australis IT-1]